MEDEVTMSNVKLKVTSQNMSNNKRWIQAVANDGSITFWYKFSGGNKNNGNNEFDVGTEDAEFEVKLKEYDPDVDEEANNITDLKFVDFINKYDAPDITGVVSSNGKRITVTDTCQDDGIFSYGADVDVTYVDSEGAHQTVQITCDPVIVNRIIY